MTLLQKLLLLACGPFALLLALAAGIASDQWRLRWLIGGAVGLVAAAAAGLWSRSLSRQLSLLHGACQRLAAGENHVRVDLPRGSALGELAESLNQLAERLDASAERAHAERREAESQLAELRARNSELNRFAHAAAHDLKGPLITIQGFVATLEAAAAAGEWEQFRGDVQRIQKAAERMRRLIDELLAFARSGQSLQPPETVSLAQLVEEAAGLLAGRIQERRAHVAWADDLPQLYGDRGQLLQVVQNLLDNALKFSGGSAEPRVEIGSRCDGAEVVCFVRDYGVGIAPEDRERVFGLFERLPSVAEGTGVGLALVRRIIERHGGRAWVESAGKGSGATFCFTLPPAPRE